MRFNMGRVPQGNTALDPRDLEAMFNQYFKGLSPEDIKFITGIRGAVGGPLPPIEKPPGDPGIENYSLPAFPRAPGRVLGTLRSNIGNGTARNNKNKLRLQDQLKLGLPQVKQTIQESSGILNTLGLNQPTTGEGLFTARMAPQPDTLAFLKSYTTPKSWTNVGKISPHNLVGNRW